MPDHWQANRSLPIVFVMKSLPARPFGAASDPAYRFGMRLAEVHRLWRAELDSRLRPLGLSTARWVALANLSAHPEGLTQNQLAIIVGIKGSTLVRQLDALEADGWVERRDSPSDRRVKKVFLTPKAQPVLESISAVGRDMRHELLHDADEAEIRACMALLDRLKGRLLTLAESDRGQRVAAE
jgi:MarR family transcriptional regulator for hemolysin